MWGRVAIYETRNRTPFPEKSRWISHLLEIDYKGKAKDKAALSSTKKTFKRFSSKGVRIRHGPRGRGGGVEKKEKTRGSGI